MHFFWLLTGILLILFSVSCGVYLVNYKLPLHLLAVKAAAGVLIAFIIFVITAALFVVVIWPPYITYFL